MNELVKLCQNQQSTVLLFAIQNVIRPFLRIGPQGSYSGIGTYPIQYNSSSVPKADDGMEALRTTPRIGLPCRGKNGGLL